MTTEIPPDIITPDSVETRLGTLKFTDGAPDAATVQKVYDNPDFMRGVDVFLNTLSATSTLSNIIGLKSVGADNFAAVIHENRVDAKTLLLTPNTQTVTLWAFMDLKDGPLVLEVPPGILGLADDAWMRYVTDIGLVRRSTHLHMAGVAGVPASSSEPGTTASRPSLQSDHNGRGPIDDAGGLLVPPSPHSSPATASEPVLNHLFLFLGRLSFIFGGALFSVVAFRHLPVLDRSADIPLLVRRGLLLTCELFALFVTLEVERLGQAFGSDRRN